MLNKSEKYVYISNIYKYVSLSMISGKATKLFAKCFGMNPLYYQRIFFNFSKMLSKWDKHVYISNIYKYIQLSMISGKVTKHFMKCFGNISYNTTAG